MASPPPSQPPAAATPPPASNPGPPVLNPAPVTRPRQPEGYGVRYPQAPTYPPTNENILEALTYSRDIAINRNTGQNIVRCDEDDVAEAAKYQHAVLAQAVAASQPEAIAPPWFNGAMEALRTDINQQIQEMKVMQRGHDQGIKMLNHRLDQVQVRLQQDIKEVREDVQADLRDLKNDVIPSLKKLLNRAQVDFDTVPFPNGEDPVAAGLPELNSSQAIALLSEEDTTTYLTRYGVTELPTRHSPRSTEKARKDLLRGLLGIASVPS